MNKKDTERFLDLFERMVEALEGLAEKEPNQVTVNQPYWVPTIQPTTYPLPGIIPNQGPGLPGIGQPGPWKPYTQPTYPGIGWPSFPDKTWITTHKNIVTNGYPGEQQTDTFGGLKVVTDESVEPGTIRVVAPGDLASTNLTWNERAELTQQNFGVSAADEAADQARTQQKLVNHLVSEYRKSAEKAPETA